MGSGVICPACIQPQFDAGKKSAFSVPGCTLCHGEGVVSVQVEIAWLKKNRIGCYAPPSAAMIRRSYFELVESIDARLKAGVLPRSMVGDGAQVRELAKQHSKLTGRHPTKPPDGGWPKEGRT